MKKVIVALMFLMVSHVASASFTLTSAGKINFLALGGSADLYILTTAPRVNPAGCSSSAYQIQASHPKFNQFYAFLLAAKANNQSVVFRVDNSTCVAGNPKIIFMQTT